MAQGHKLKAICVKYNLNFESWCGLVQSDMFKEELAKMEQEFHELSLSQALEDPAVQALRSEAVKSVERLAKERDNFSAEDGASASTRIASSDKLLSHFLGINKKKGDQEQQPIIQINLSQGKVDFVTKRASSAYEKPTTIEAPQGGDSRTAHESPQETQDKSSLELPSLPPDSGASDSERPSAQGEEKVA